MSVRKGCQKPTDLWRVASRVGERPCGGYSRADVRNFAALTAVTSRSQVAEYAYLDST